MLYHRFKHFYKNNGFYKTLLQCINKAYCIFKIHKFLLYYTDEYKAIEFDSHKYSIKRYDAMPDIKDRNINELCKYFDKHIFLATAKQNFNKKSVLWILIDNSSNAPLGIIWSIRANTVSTHFFPLCSHDCHMFSNEILSHHRGKGYNTILLNYVIHKLKQEGISRIHIETATDNYAEQNSLKKTPFINYGVASKYHFFRQFYTIWYK